jgi:hypothetical protein
MNMPNKQLVEEGDPLDGKYDPELDERLRTMKPTDPDFDAWLKKKYDHNPYIKAPQVKVKKRRKSNRPPRS